MTIGYDYNLVINGIRESFAIAVSHRKNGMLTFGFSVFVRIIHFQDKQ